MGSGGTCSGGARTGASSRSRSGSARSGRRTGLFVLASVIDLTARRQAEDELRASQQELQLLDRPACWRPRRPSGGGSPANCTTTSTRAWPCWPWRWTCSASRRRTSAAEVADRLRELSARVKELSSSVHDLSHQLHPSKLEQLGLVAAVRGLCQELAQATAWR